jgi:hypothetical protein
MNIRASGRSALILATGLFVCFAGPSPASAGADSATAAAKSENAAAQKHGSRHSKSNAQRTSDKQALKSTAKAATPDAAVDDADNSLAIPPSVANANANVQFAPAGTPAGNARAMSARANDILQTTEAQPAADSQVVAADQLNDVDRALHEGQPPAPTMALASAEAPVAPAAPVMASSQESSTWDQTSLIGKIFIGFGALLTMASAARMFMA